MNTTESDASMEQYCDSEVEAENFIKHGYLAAHAALLHVTNPDDPEDRHPLATDEAERRAVNMEPFDVSIVYCMDHREHHFVAYVIGLDGVPQDHAKITVPRLVGGNILRWTRMQFCEMGRELAWKIAEGRGLYGFLDAAKSRWIVKGDGCWHPVIERWKKSRGECSQ